MEHENLADETNCLRSTFSRARAWYSTTSDETPPPGRNAANLLYNTSPPSSIISQADQRANAHDSNLFVRAIFSKLRIPLTKHYNNIR